MIVEDTKDLVETDDYVIIEATFVRGRFVVCANCRGHSQRSGRHCSYYSHFHQPNLTKRPGSYLPGYFYAHFCFFRGVGGFCGRGACIYCTGHLGALRWSFANYL